MFKVMNDIKIDTLFCSGWLNDGRDSADIKRIIDCQDCYSESFIQNENLKESVTSSHSSL